MAVDNEALARRIEEPADARGGRLARFARSVARKLVAPELDRQQGTNRELLTAIEQLRGELGKQLELGQMEIRAEIMAIQRHVGRTDADTAAHMSQLVARLDGLAAQQVDLVQHLAEVRALPYIDEALAFEVWEQPGTGVVQGFRHNLHDDDDDEFHDAFRGSEARVRELQRPYVEMLAAETPILDLGCGRGEMLDLLQAAEVTDAIGVDLDPKMVAHSHRKGHQVVLGDAIEGLGAQTDDSLGAIFSDQLIEHLPYEALLRLLELATDKLRPGGLFVAGTVNPHCVNALKAFWIDPTHEHPLFPEAMLQLARRAGFDSAYIFHPGASGDIEADRFVAPGYALVARAH